MQNWQIFATFLALNALPATSTRPAYAAPMPAQSATQGEPSRAVNSKDFPAPSPATTPAAATAPGAATTPDEATQQPDPQVSPPVERASSSTTQQGSPTSVPASQQSSQSTAASLSPTPSPDPSQQDAPQTAAETRPPTAASQLRDLQQTVQDMEEERQQKLKEQAPTWAVHVNVLNLLVDDIVLGVDRAVADRLQLTAQASYYDTKVAATDNVGISVGAGVRYYPLSNGYRGWYVSPTLSYRVASLENKTTGENGTAKVVVAGAMTGSQWILGGVLLRTGLGLARTWDAGTHIDGQLNTELNGWGLALDGAVGFAF